MPTQKKIIHKGMVDVSHKPVTKRVAVASAQIQMSPEAFKIFLTQGSPKGDVLETAKVAAVMAAKATPRLIPFCHPLELNKVNVDFQVHKKDCAIGASVEVICLGRTGVEMEALTAASVAMLTIYDMMKWADHAMRISEIKLLKKSGGQSGDYTSKD